MKKNKSNNIISIFTALFLAVIMIGCDIDKTINNSPNAINEESVKSVVGVNGLTVALEVVTGEFYAGDRSRISSIWTRQMCAPDGLGRPQPVSWNSFNMVEDGPTQDMWTLGYRGVKLANDIVKYAPLVTFAAGADNARFQAFYLGMAKTQKAIMFGELAAYYGSIPIVIDGLNAPSFATQKEAYAEVQKLLGEALVHFAAAGAKLTFIQDLNFKGDAAKWIPMVHTLKARYYLHVKDYANSLTEATAGMATGVFNAISSDNPNETSVWGHWVNTEVGEPIRGEATFVNLLKAEKGDTRLNAYFKAGDDDAAGTMWGYAQFEPAKADSHETNTAYTVRLVKYAAYVDPFTMVSAAENSFIKAEALARTGNAAGATTELNALRKAAGLADYAGTTVIAEILKQKFLTLFLEGQSYTDMRRASEYQTVINLPRRWTYPANEKNANTKVPLDAPTLITEF